MQVRSFLVLILLGALGVLGSAARAQEAGGKVQAPGLFSYQAPPGWKVMTSPMSKYDISLGAPENSFSPNINVVMESYPKSLADYVSANEAALKGSPMFTRLEVISETPFVTNNGVKGVLMLVKDTLGKLDLRQAFYIFPGAGNNKFVVTASTLAASGDRDAPLFNAALKTFSTP